MRTNIVLDDKLVTQALALTGASSKKEVVNLALSRLVDSYKEKDVYRHHFIEAYIDKPIKIENFVSLAREEGYER